MNYKSSLHLYVLFPKRSFKTRLSFSLIVRKNFSPDYFRSYFNNVDTKAKFFDDNFTREWKKNCTDSTINHKNSRILGRKNIVPAPAHGRKCSGHVAFRKWVFVGMNTFSRNLKWTCESVQHVTKTRSLLRKHETTRIYMFRKIRRHLKNLNCEIWDLQGGIVLNSDIRWSLK